MNSLRHVRARLPLIMVFFILSAAIVISLELIQSQREDFHLLGIEIGKLAAQLSLIALTGGLAIQEFTLRQRQREALREMRARCQDKLARSYTGIKKARRELRASQRSNTSASAIPQFDPSILRTHYEEQMGTVNDLQLELEILIHEVNAIPQLFKEWKEIRGHISKMCDYLSSVITEYEGSPSGSSYGDSRSVQDLPLLKDMLHGEKAGPFRTRFTQPFHEALSRIQSATTRIAGGLKKPSQGGR